MTRKRLIDKPVVKFLNEADFEYRVLDDPDQIEEYRKFLDKGNGYEVAKVYCINHPILGKDFVRTSIVLKKHKDGSFETMNTLYVPVQLKD